MSSDNICVQCGGIVRIEYTIGFEQCRPRDMRVNLDNKPDRPLRLCAGHPEPAPKHDGKLDDEGQHKVSQSYGAWGFEGVILEYEGHTAAMLNPKKALSLLAWLTQEKAALEELVEEVPLD
jgi:hypothetical protein